jgi:hypothetical protein
VSFEIFGVGVGKVRGIVLWVGLFFCGWGVGEGLLF